MFFICLILLGAFDSDDLCLIFYLKKCWKSPRIIRVFVSEHDTSVLLVMWDPLQPDVLSLGGD